MRLWSICVVAALILALTPFSAFAEADPELVSKHFQTSDGVELHYLEAGSGLPLVFVPGWTMPAEIWDPQLKHFATSHRVVGLDPRSQGRSERPTDGHYLSRRGQDIGDLIAHLDAGPVVVVGWSLAVLEILTYAQEVGTESLRAAVLVDMFIGRDLGPNEQHPLAAPWLTPLQTNRAEFTDAFVRGMFRVEHSDEYIQGIVKAALVTPTNTAVTLVTNVYPLGVGDWRPALDALDRSLMYVVTAGNSGRAQMVRERRPDARVEVIDGAGHALFVDQPAQFNRVLEEFLASVED